MWRGRWLILAATVASVGIAVLATALSPKVYRATTLLQFDQAAAGANPSDVFNAQQASQNLAVTYATVIQSSSFLERIRPGVVGGRYSTPALQAAIFASPVENTGLVSISAEAGSPRAARILASSVARSFLDAVQEDVQSRALAQEQVIIERIARLKAEIARLNRLAAAGDDAAAQRLATERQAYEAATQQLADARGAGLPQGAQLSLVGPPRAAASPVRPRPVLNILAGLLLGLLLGFGLAWLRVRLDVGLHSSDEAARTLDVPVLASIPLRRRRPGREDHLADRMVEDAYDVLQTNIRFSADDDPIDVIAVTSFGPGEGKSSVARGLAEAVARSGRSVLLVDGDLRMRALSNAYHCASAPGLTTMVVDRTVVLDAPGQSVTPSTWSGLPSIIVEVKPNLYFLPTGPRPPNPLNLLHSGRLRERFQDLRSQYSLVVVDTPPTANLADASVLASLSDGVILVARVGVTNRAGLATAATNLRASGTPILGTVVFQSSSTEPAYEMTPGSATAQTSGIHARL